MLTKEISGGILGYEDVSTPHHRVLTKPKPMKSGVDMDKLDERKLKILQAIIRNYLETGEPVGSRTISKYTDLNLSSATIRNDRITSYNVCYTKLLRISLLCRKTVRKQLYYMAVNLTIRNSTAIFS